MAVELALNVRTNPASAEINDCPVPVFSSVTRKMRDPKVGSFKTEFAGPKAGAGGIGFGSVPV